MLDKKEISKPLFTKDQLYFLNTLLSSCNVSIINDYWIPRLKEGMNFPIYRLLENEKYGIVGGIMPGAVNIGCRDIVRVVNSYGKG